MTPEVLVLAGLYDFSADLVCLKLRELGTSYFRLNREQLSDFRITIDPSGACVRVTSGDRSWSLTRDLRSVWFRQPVFLRNLPAEPLTPDIQLERSQWMGVLHGLTMFEDAAWINHPRETFHAESKILQLAVAKRVGFDVPKTIVSNDPDVISSMFPGQFALKPVDTVLLRDQGDDLFAYMIDFNGADLQTSSLARIPIIAQELLDKKRDIRVTVIGDYVSAVRITRNREPIEGDWRLTPRGDLHYEDLSLPAHILIQCRRMMKELGLTYAGIDLLETERGFVFLEANPTGEFAWLIAPDRQLDFQIACHLAIGPSTRHVDV